MIRLFLFLLFFLSIPALFAQVRPNRDTARTFAALEQTLLAHQPDPSAVSQADPSAVNPPQPPPPANPELLAALDQLIKAVSVDAAVRIDRRAPGITLETDGLDLFRPDPTLPAEVKQQGNWTFTTLRFEVVPRNLLIRDLRFSADHTYRIRRVSLFFRDGTAIHDKTWSSADNPNGKVFSRHRFTPRFQAWSSAEPEQARALAALEIEGSAQDGPHRGKLRFEITVPDPMARPYREALAQLKTLQTEWTSQPFDAASWEKAKSALPQLAKALDLTPLADGARP